MKKYYRYATISPTKMMGRINWKEINEAGSHYKKSFEEYNDEEYGDN